MYGNQSSSLEFAAWEVRGLEVFESSGLYVLEHMASRYRRMRDGRGFDWAAEERQDHLADIVVWMRENGFDFGVTERSIDTSVAVEPAAETQDNAAPAAEAAEAPDKAGEAEPEPADKAAAALPPAGPAGVPAGMGDEPALEDKLGRAGLVSVLAAMCQSPEQATPFTVALLGDWGTGKSSVMVQMRQKIEAEADGAVDFAWFNAWEYEQVDDVKAGLAQAVVNGLMAEVAGWREKRGWMARVSGLLEKYRLIWRFALSQHRAEMWKLVFQFATLSAMVFLGSTALLIKEVIDWLTATSILGASLIAFGVYAWRAALPVFEAPLWRDLNSYMKLPDYRKRMGEVPVMKRHLKELCRLRGVGDGGEDRRLVLVVDDLDRCENKTIVAMLDAIRLALELPGVVVMIAMDPRIAMHAVTEHYDLRGRDYLGKLIQIPIRLDRPTADEIDTFVREKLFENADDKTEGDGGVSTEPPLEPSVTSGSESAEGTEALPSESKPLPEKSKPPRPDDASAGREEPAPPQSPAPRAENPEGPPQATNVEIKEEEASKAGAAPTIAALQEYMRDTPAELELFAELCPDHGFNNPRQLIRLRNTYRLLKALDWTRRPAAAQEADLGHDPEWLMRTIFWYEYVLENRVVIRPRWAVGSLPRELVLREPSLAVVRVVDPEVAKRLYELWMKMREVEAFADPGDPTGIHRMNFHRAATLAERGALPYHEPKENGD
ncbi:MAG: P-loop NTPase fold protein [Planctomycetota bacterium]